MKKVLSKKFFEQDTERVARGLLGKFLVRKRGKKELAGMITEVEVYDGWNDKASHASRGQTPRNTPMFGPAGHWYVYFTYGVHWMLNIVTREPGFPAAVLIRAVQFAGHSMSSKTDGPAKLTKALGIDRRFNAKPAARAAKLWIEDRGIKITPQKIKKTPRIGVSYAGRWAKKPLRYLIKE